MASLDVALDNDNNLYVTGLVPGIELVDTLPYNGANNTFIAQFDSSLQLVWSTNWGGSGYDYIRDTVFDSDSSFYLIGETTSSDFPELPPSSGIDYQDTLNGNSDAFIAKFTNNQLVWATYLGGDSTDIANSACIDDSNNLYLCGTTFSTDFPVCNMGSPAFYEDSLYGTTSIPYFAYSGDGFISKYSSLGQRLHNTYYGEASGDGFSDMAIDSKGDIYVSGSSGSSSIPFASQNPIDFYSDSILIGDQDGILLSFDSQLQLQWTSYFGGYTTLSGLNQDWITSLTITHNNMLFIVGETNSNHEFPLVVYPNTQIYSDTVVLYYDGFIARFALGNTIGFENQRAIDNNILLYPNPANSKIYLKTDINIEQYKIYNIAGQLIGGGEYDSGIPIANLKPGLYILSVDMDGIFVNLKFIKKD